MHNIGFISNGSNADEGKLMDIGAIDEMVQMHHY